MDNEAIKARNYRMVETLRHQNRREQIKLEKALYSRQGVLATHQYELQEMSRERKRIKKELVRIRQTGGTTFGVLPPREYGLEDSETNMLDVSVAEDMMNLSSPRNTERPQSRRTRKLKKVKEKTLEEQKLTEERLRQFNEAYPLDSDSSPVTSREEKTRDRPSNSQSQMTSSNSKLTNSQSQMFKEGRSGAKQADDTHRKTGLQRETSISDINIDVAKEKIAKRLIPENRSENSIPEHSAGGRRDTGKPKTDQDKRTGQLTTLDENFPSNSTPETKQSEPAEDTDTKPKQTKKKKNSKNKKGANDEEESKEPAFDTMKYNPDGSLRTVHVLPDFHGTFKEAKKARYVRNKEKQWFEKELSIREIFDRNKKEKTLILFS